MFDLIERLRQKPHGVKKRIAFFSAFSFSLVIFIIWFTVLYPDLKQGEEKQTANAGSAPISTVSAMFEEGLSGISKSIADLKEAVASLPVGENSLYYTASSTVSATASSSDSAF